MIGEAWIGNHTESKGIAICLLQFGHQTVQETLSSQARVEFNSLNGQATPLYFLRGGKTYP
jgi:hypothetical protein